VTTEQFQQHILPHKNKLFRFALSYLRVEADAKDLVQEVMMNAWERIPDPQSIKNMEAWCMTLTRNKALNMLKRKGRHTIQLEDQFDLSSSEATPLQKTESQESVNKIHKIIASLPVAQREVISLRDIEGYSYKEIADILQLEMNHVKVLLFRARKQVKEQLIRVHNYGISKAK